MKPCAVTFTDLNGLRQTVELEADTVYEAAVLALQAFRKASFAELPPGLASRFQVVVREPIVTHEVSLLKVREWVERGSTNPAEVIRKQRLREILERSLPKSV